MFFQQQFIIIDKIMAKISIIRQDDIERTIYVKSKDGNAYDLTDCKIFFTVKTNSNLTDTDDDDAIIKKSVAITDAVNGVAKLSLTTIDTDIKADEYFYDFQIVDAQGKITSCIKDNFEVIQDVSKRIISN